MAKVSPSRMLVALLLAAASLLASPHAAARGAMIDVSRLGTKARRSLLDDIARARTADAAPFRVVGSLRADLIALDRSRHHRMAGVAPALRALGARGLMPLLEELAVRSAGRAGMTDTAWQTWRVGLLEAVGAIRDGRAEAVLTAILTGPESDSLLVQTAAAALGKLGSDSAAGTLVTLGKQRGKKGLAVLAGMGHCRRQRVAVRLAAALASADDHREAMIIGRALGDVGSAWAWKTPLVARSGEATQVRATAAAALVNGFLAYGHAEVRALLAQAILVVDDPSTPSLIAKARRGAGAEDRAALDALAARFAENPVR